ESGVVTSGFGKREDRRWLVESLAFSLSSSGFTFTFNLVAEIKSKKSGDKTPPDYFGTGSGKK
ncbi:late control protein D, partial [Escherichia coli]|nr:late control protein D [Escherichia coli]